LNKVEPVQVERLAIALSSGVAESAELHERARSLAQAHIRVEHGAMEEDMIFALLEPEVRIAYHLHALAKLTAKRQRRGRCEVDALQLVERLRLAAGPAQRAPVFVEAVTLKLGSVALLGRSGAAGGQEGRDQ
jgi:hypothetical protein